MAVLPPFKLLTYLAMTSIVQWGDTSFFQLARGLTKLNMSATIASQALSLLFFLCLNSPFDFSSSNHSGQIPSGIRGCSKLEIFQEGSNSVTLALSGLLPFDKYSAAGLRELS